MGLKKLSNTDSGAIKIPLKIDQGLFLIEKSSKKYECILADLSIKGDEDYFKNLNHLSGYKYIGSEAVYNKVKEFNYVWLSKETRSILLDKTTDVFYLPVEGKVRIPKVEINKKSKVNSSIVNKAVENKKLFEVTSLGSTVIDPNRKKKVLVIDDSATIQKILKMIISASDKLEVMNMASCPSEAREMIEKEKPDLITLDIHMPEMNGVEFLKTYLNQFSIPVVMISSVSITEGPLVMDALGNGAQSYIQKPSLAEVDELAGEIRTKLENIANYKKEVNEKEKPKAIFAGQFKDTEGLVVIGSSTGGTNALEELFVSLPDEIPPIVVVQHIPAVFSKALADRLNSLCGFRIKEGVNEEYLEPNTVYIAPGGFQCKILNRHGRYSLDINDDMPVNRFKPSVDYLFNSAVNLPIDNRVGIILTGMGDDGADGMLKLHQSGVKTIAQNKKTCVVFGMPKEAIERGGVDHILGLHEISSELVNIYNKQKTKVA